MTNFTDKLAYFHAAERALKRVEGKRGKEIGRCREVGSALLRAPSLVREQAGRKGQTMTVCGSFATMGLTDGQPEPWN